MSASNVSYLTFGIVLLLAVVFDLGLLSRKGTTVTIRKALFQTAFWVMLAMAFFGFLWYENGHKMALEYLSAYLMEWSLSIDNIFVFILIFSLFPGEACLLCPGIAHRYTYGHRVADRVHHGGYCGGDLAA